MTPPEKLADLHDPQKFYIKTYGCQMNGLDGLQMGRLLKARGYAATAHPEDADVILVNTCSIREKASQKVYSDVGRFRSLKLKRPEIVLGVTGCQAQAEGAQLQKRFPYLDLVLGPDHTAHLPDLVAELKAKKSPASLHRSSQHKMTQVGFTKPDNYQFLHLLPEEDENSVKAFMTIMKGCDNFCSFCIVPYVRGREVCREPDDIVTEAKALAKQGVQEITLLGQNVNSYGVGRHSEEARAKKGKSPFISFAALLSRLNHETDLKRIRFTTSHPKDMPVELIEEFGKNNKLARQLHLPVQSGSNKVLERMYRGYTREEFLTCMNKFKNVDADIALSTDIIVGFPGESDADFEETMDLLREVRFDSIYSFVYSSRPKTTAAKHFEDDIPLKVKQKRLARLQALQDQITLEKNQAWLGKTLQVLVEGPSKQGTSFCGRSSQNHMIHFEGCQDDVGQIVEINITHAGSHSLLGEKLKTA